MTVSRREMLAAGAASLPVFAVAAQAQTPPPAGAAAGQQPKGRDPLLATCLLIGGRKMIEKCQFAMGKLTSDDAKQFARAEIEEHENNKRKLKEFGYEFPSPAGSQPPQQGFFGSADATRQSDADRTTGAAGSPTNPNTITPPASGSPAAGTGTTNATAGTSGAAGAWANQPVQPITLGNVVIPGAAAEQITLELQIADQCLRNYKEMMGKYQGAKLDKAFIGDQKHGHLMLLDQVQTFQKHASAEMQPQLAQSEQIIRQHLQRLEQIMEKLDQQGVNEKDNKDTGSEKKDR